MPSYICTRKTTVTFRILPTFAALTLGNALHAENPKPVWALVGSDAMRAAAQPLAAFREKEGFEVRQVASHREAGAADYVLLLGDENILPPDRLPFYRWMSSQQESFATDLSCADVDGDGLPNAAVGRIPAASPRMIEKVVEKITRYESRVSTIGDLALPMWTGTSMVGKLADEITGFALRNTVSRKAPRWADPWMMTGNPRETLSAHPHDQAALFNKRLGGGAVMAFFMGHGSRGHFYSYTSGKGWWGYTHEHADALEDGEPSAPAIIFACDCGDWATSKISVAEAMLFASAGPVASIAATTQSHPLTNYYSGMASLNELNHGKAERLGDYWNAVQREAFFKREAWAEFVLKEVEGKLENEIDIPKLKRDHALMYALLGDPATRLRVPLELSVLWKKVGGAWEWAVERPSGAESGELVVSHRGGGESEALRAIPEGTTPQQARRLFEARNAGYAFRERERLAFDEPWNGRVTARGEWRFVVTGGQRPFAAVREAN